MEKGTEQVAARRAADQEYRNRHRSDTAARSMENANFKRRCQESCQRSAAERSMLLVSTQHQT